jgi:hypothetical protein
MHLTLKLLVALITSIPAQFCSAQIDSSIIAFHIPDDHLPRTITDKKSHLTFILDSSHIYVAAYNQLGERLWRTDPWEDASLDSERVSRPRIVAFYLQNDRQTHFMEVVAIIYNSSQFGFLDKKTGKFRYYGRD